jgi:tRNA (cytidine/uridine-2'-O-)-methyltransferase
MFQIVLYQPEIPPNTGNVMRLAANTGCRLHLVRPLGFSLSDRALTRAGMDYRERAALTVHDDWEACRAALGGARLFALTTRGAQRHDCTAYAPGDALLFGAETRGLPRELIDALPASQRIRLPMRPDSRSLNLGNAVAVVVYEAWRQQGYAGADPPREGTC